MVSFRLLVCWVCVGCIECRKERGAKHLSFYIRENAAHRKGKGNRESWDGQALLRHDQLAYHLRMVVSAAWD
jgi:hypothetical protein